MVKFLGYTPVDVAKGAKPRKTLVCLVLFLLFYKCIHFVIIKVRRWIHERVWKVMVVH